MDQADRIIAALKLRPHPEGGHYRETFRDVAKDRAHSTAIYFLLKRGEVSRLHRVDAAEVWHFYAGAPLELTVISAKGKRRMVLGAELSKKQRPQIVVPAHQWQSARTFGAFTLVGCTVAPGFEFSGFEIAANADAPALSATRAQSRATRRSRRSRARD